MIQVIVTIVAVWFIVSISLSVINGLLGGIDHIIKSCTGEKKPKKLYYCHKDIKDLLKGLR